jgi:hypothetical protein
MPLPAILPVGAALAGGAAGAGTAAAASSLLTPALIGAGGSIAGSLIGAAGSYAGAGLDADMAREMQEAQFAHTDKWNRKQLRFAKKQFRHAKHLTKHSIKRQVRDAKQAGLHPLYALGNSMSHSPVSFIPGQSPQGSFVKSGVGAAAREIGRGVSDAASIYSQHPLQVAQINALNAQASRDEAAAAYSFSVASRVADGVNVNQDTPVHADQIRSMPSKVVSHKSKKPQETAGIKPAFDRYRIGWHPDGRPMTIGLPYSEEGPAESLGAFASLILSGLNASGVLDLRKASKTKASKVYWALQKLKSTERMDQKTLERRLWEFVTRIRR